MTLCRNHVDVLRVLVEKGGLDVNVTNAQRLTPLHVAVRQGHVDSARQLITYGADVNAAVLITRPHRMHRVQRCGLLRCRPVCRK